MTIRETFSDRLKETRKKSGLSQTELAKRLGASQATISNMESGENLDKIEDVANIAKELGVSLDWLCGVEEKRPPLSFKEWFLHLDAMLNNPPKNQHKPVIELKQNGNEWQLCFTGEGANELFKQYMALRAIQAQFPKDTYKTMLHTVLSNKEKQFEPGYDIYTVGAEVDQPPRGDQ